jgi:hypothetical protein
MYDKLLNNNNNIIMLIMTLIIIGLLIYIIKISQKVNKEGFVSTTSTFGGVQFAADYANNILDISGNVNVRGTLTSTDMSIPGNILNKRNLFVLRSNTSKYLYTDDEIVLGYDGYPTNNNFSPNTKNPDKRFLWYQMGGRICNAGNNKCLTITGTTLIDNNNQGSIGPQVMCKPIAEDGNRNQIFIIIQPLFFNHLVVSIIASSTSNDMDGASGRYLYLAPSNNIGLRVDAPSYSKQNDFDMYFKWYRIYVS